MNVCVIDLGGFFPRTSRSLKSPCFHLPQVCGDGLSTGVGLGRRLEGYVVALAKKLAPAGPFRRLSEFSLKKV